MIEVAAAVDDAGYALVDASFMRDKAMRDKASTRSFRRQLEVSDDILTCQETTVLDVYGKIFDHSDGNTLSGLVDTP